LLEDADLLVELYLPGCPEVYWFYLKKYKLCRMAFYVYLSFILRLFGLLLDVMFFPQALRRDHTCLLSHLNMEIFMLKDGF